MSVKFTMRYTAIEVAHLDRALDFYVGKLGMKLTAKAKVPETKGEFAVVRTEGSDH